MRWNKKSLFAVINNHLIDYPTPINLSYFYGFGSLAGIMLVIQILTGIFLAMHYTPHIDLAFNSVEHIMRDVNNGWLMRYTHANGASFFFIVVYVHIFRGLYYGSYITPREYLWCSGVVIFILMMATAFMGYVLPWGQMSFWGATVITNLFSAIPVIGKDIVDWLWGGFAVDNPTLNRFFSLHFTMPFVIVGAVLIHLILLHEVGSTNPLGITLKTENVPFYPYFYTKDLFGLMVLLFVFFIFVFYYPNTLGHPDNYIEANPMKTPLHIVPEWYFLPFYAILRSIPNKIGGVIGMFGSLIVMLTIPFTNSSEIRSTAFRPIFKVCYWLLVVAFFLLGWVGQMPVEYPYTEIGVVSMIYYFFFFIVIIPFLGKFESFLIRYKKK
jgi:ubiquinol-cytochrome c reductase cytochrome b subunit|uniref:Cytochrome b n=1 Tax=Globisporangium ultimum TaxID=2052682 RepID=D8WJ85_GLOUL|nr:apocytochrome b [Globisporangium ultimum]YP_003734849.1 apocytochrome b [Globisporangium ultimum]ACZ43867.1 apocytochrome b [Globisporangium ultimum]ACZ43884.1 apocytochrome b [Globisporangium ultimum]